MSNRRITANASWIMIGRALQLLLTFFTTMYVTRYLGPYQYGKMTYVYSYIQLFLPLCTLGMNDIVVKELIDRKDESEEVLGTIIGLRLVSSVISMFLSVFAVTRFNINPSYKIIAIYQSFSLLFQSFDTLMYFYQAQLLSKTTGIIFVLAYTISSLYKLLGIYLHRSLVWFAFGMSVDYIAFAILLVIVYYLGRNRLHFSFAMAKDLLSKSLYYLFAGVLVVIYGKVTEIIFLGKMVSEVGVGYYSAATTLCNAWPFVLTAIIDSLGPVIIKTYPEDRELFHQKLRQLYAIIFYVSVVVAIGISLFSMIAIDILYGPSYYEASTVMKIYSWSTPFSYIGVARTVWMQCEKKTRYETVISLFGAFANIVLNYILIRQYGIKGAAFAAVLTQFLTNYVFLYLIDDTRENAKLITDAVFLKGVFPKK